MKLKYHQMAKEELSKLLINMIVNFSPVTQNNEFCAKTTVLIQQW